VNPAEIRAYFNHAAADEEHYPSTIDPRIYHVKLVLDHLGDVSGKRVADVGCGKGRFARIEGALPQGLGDRIGSG
jgi:malonyl-CoA O-methyltransferase